MLSTLWITLGQQFAALLGAWIAIAPIHELNEPCCPRWGRFEKRLKISKADHGNAAAEDLRRECRADERRVAAIR